MRRSDASTGEPATLADVLVTDQLARRTARTPDHSAENAAPHALRRRMADRPDGLLAALADAGLRLCHAGTAGVSMLATAPRGPDAVLDVQS